MEQPQRICGLPDEGVLTLLMKGQVICVQLGARDHYGFPRALHKAGGLKALITDYWSPHAPLPRLLQSKRMRGRQHVDLAGAHVQSSSLRTLFEALWLRMGTSRKWDRILRQNEWFQREVVKSLRRMEEKSMGKEQSPEGSPVLFAYSYAARDLLAQAKRHGWTTILGQIDPGPVEAEIVQAEAARWPEFGAPRDPAPARYWACWRKELDLADHIVVNSAWSRSALVRAGVEECKLRVIPLPYEEGGSSSHAVKKYPAKFTDQRPLRVLYLGQVSHRKGVPALLAALDIIHELPVELWMVGSVGLKVPERYQQDARIRWLGPVERSGVTQFYLQADVFVFPTHSDGFGLTQLEAQACKMPVIASRNCGEVVVHGENGMVLDRVTPEAIAEALRHCCSQPEVLARWSEASGVPSAFSLNAVAEQLWSLV